MSNEFKVGVKLHVDSTQYTAEFTKAGQTAQAFAAQVSGSASGAAQGVQSIVGKLDGLGQAASNGNTAAAAIDKITFSGRQAAVALGAIPQPLTGAAAHFQTAQAGLAGVARQGDAVKTALNGGIPAAKAFGAAADSASQQAAKAGGVAQAALGQTTISARQTAAALRGVPAQFTDIITSIQGGQAPLTVFLQQGGQLKDMFGGAIPAAKALTGYVFGLVNPLTLAAAAAGVLALAYHQGSQEADGYRASIVMSGNAAGTTVGQLTDMARAISEVTGTQGAAAAALTQMAGSGAVARENLQQFTQTAMGLEKYVGQPVKATVDHLEQLGKAPLQASLKLNEQYHHLTVAVYEHIRSLEEQGRKEEAGAAAQQAYMAAMEARKNEMVANLGYIERAWMGVASAAKGAWDWMLGVGRATTDQQNLAQLRENLARQQERNASLGIKDGQATADLKEQIRLLEKKITLSSDNASAQAQGAKAVEHEAEWTKIVNANKSKEKQQEDEILRIRNAGKAAGKDQLDIEREIAAYKARVADKGAAGAAARELEQQKSLLAELAGLSGDFYKDWERLNKQFKDGKLTAEQLTQEQEKLLAKQPGIKAAREAELKVMQAQYAEQQRISEEIIQAELARDRAVQSGRAAVAEYAKQVDEANRYLQVERDTVNATASQRALSIELLRIQLGLEKQLEAIRTNEGFTQADREEQRAKALSVAAQARANATARAELDHVRDLREELKRVTEQYEQGLTNAAIQGGKSLREYIQGMLRATAFRIVLDPIMKPLAGLLAGVTGGSSAAASQGGGLMGTANLLSSAYSALTTGVSSSITSGFAKLAGSSFGQSIGLSNSSAIMGNNPSAFVPAGGQLTPLGQSIGTGLGMLGSGLAGYGISSAISNGYTTGGNTVNVLSGIASAFLGPIAGVVGGLSNRAFGRKLKDTGIEGTIGGTAGFEGNSYQFYKGGWFRSDKTVRGELDAGVDKSLDTAVKQMQLSMAGLAMSIGAPTEAISGFSQAIKLSFNGLDEAGIQEKITQTLADYNEALASAFIASVDRSEVPKWVDRLLGNVDASAVERLQAVSEWPAKLLQSIGTSRDQLAQLYAEGLASGDATKAGQAVADSLVASIEASMLGNASAQVFDIVNQGIVTPMLDAILLGQNVSEALSEASIQKTIERAKETASAFSELWNNAEFKSALDDIRTTVGSALGQTGSAMEYIPRYTQIDATNAAAAAAERAAEERGGLERQLMELQGDTVGLRARERNALDESNRALFDHVMALGDAARNTQLLRENTDSLVQSLASSVQSALSARNTAGSLLDRINGAIGGDGAAYAMRREQELWAAMSQASYKQQIELAGELTDSVLARMQLERESADKLTAIHRSLRDSIEATRLGALSPLTLGKKLQEASAQFEAAVAKARGGDTDAASQVVGLRETYLGLAQRYYAASDAYTTVFNASESAISGLAGTLQTESQRQLALSTDTLGALQQLRDVAQAAYSAADTDYTQSLAAMQEQSALLVSMDGGIGTLGDILSGLPADLAAQLQPLLGKGVADADVIAMLRGAQAASPGMMMGDLVAYGLGNGATAAQLAAVRTKLYSDAEVAEMLAQGRINYPGATDEQLQQLGLVQYGITEQQFKRVNGSHFNGLERVPFDGYIAQLHAREMVVPAQQADIFRSMDFSSFGRGVESMVGEIKSMRSELQSARAENAQLMAMLAKVMQSTSEGTAQQLRQAVRDVALAGVKPR